MERLLSCGRAAMVVTTQGSAGAVMLQETPSSIEEPHNVLGSPIVVRRTSSMGGKRDFLRCPAYPIPAPPLDTTGAGDAFIAGTLFGIVKGLSAERALILGSYTAAMQIQQLGARTGLPARETVPNFLLG